MENQLVYFWFRRDLRLEDNAGLYRALRSGKKVQAVFIFDKEILDKLSKKDDARVTFIYDQLRRLDEELRAYGAGLQCYYGRPNEVWDQLLSQHPAQSIYCNMDYEPYAKARDRAIADLALKHGASFHTFKDHVIFHQDEVLKKDGTPYTVFTPYKRQWLARLETRFWPAQDVSYYLASYPTLDYAEHLAASAEPPTMPTLDEMGFSRSEQAIPPAQVASGLIRRYDEQRDFPAVEGTSRLGIHFRFGTISIREKARKALNLNATYLSELIWRDFYSQILDHFPHVVDGAFRPKYDEIPWRNDASDFEAWCKGRTGYPLVDAGMRELNHTGHMHNRVRMVVASFLTKHLLIDWRWGEAYFAQELLDFDLASNNGGWQWAAGSGTDAAPYFRIFNPESQLKRFDGQLAYTKKWVPELGTDAYPEPIVPHKYARERCLSTYQSVLKK